MGDTSRREPREPEITVNGRRLTPAQAMTVRVALGNFAIDLTRPDALGADEHGRAMTRGYLNALREIMPLMIDPRPFEG